jgi:GT2 family glycosyltransferase
MAWSRIPAVGAGKNPGPSTLQLAGQGLLGWPAVTRPLVAAAELGLGLGVDLIGGRTHALVDTLRSRGLGAPKLVANIHALTVNHKSAAHLEKLLHSLDGLEISSCSVLDNASGQDEVNKLMSLKCEFPDVSFTFSDRNHGFGGGVNQLVASLLEHSPQDVRETDYFWILNPDVVVTKRAFETLREAANQREADIFSPVITTGGAGNSWYAGGDLDLMRGRISFWDRPAAVCGMVSCSFVTGAAMLVNVGAFTALGGFKEELFLYWEDAELCIRAQTHGYRTGVHAGAEVWHHVGGSSGERRGSDKSPVFFYYFTRNRLWVCGPASSRVRLAVGMGARHTLRPLLWAARQRSRPLRKVWAVFAGTFAGLRDVPAPLP